MARRRLALWLTLLSAFFVSSATIGLERVRPPSEDEIWILSISAKLATDGVLGTDLYKGYFNADSHWFIHLPGLHLLHYIAFKVAGVGIAEARWVSVIGAVVVLWVTGILAYRWYGLRVAGMATLLLVFWRSGLIGMDIGLPLLGLARSMRYDMTVVMAVSVTVLCLDSFLRRPGRARAFGVGLSCGAASLTHFLGFAAIPLVGFAWLWTRGKRALSDRTILWTALGFLVVLIPYLIYVASHWADVKGQSGFGMMSRVPSPGIRSLAANVVREPQRFVGLLRPGVGRWLLLFGFAPALVYLVQRLRSGGTVGDRLLFSSFAVPALLLALFEVTKAPLYANVLWAPVCVIIALGAVQGIRWGAMRPTTVGLAVTASLALLLGLAIMEGAGAYWYNRRMAPTVSSYEEVGAQIAASVGGDAIIAGPPRFWWPLRRHQYLAINNLRLQWQTLRDQGTNPTFSALIRTRAVDFILMDDGSRADLLRYPPEFRPEFQAFLDECTSVTSSLVDRIYGLLVLYAVRPACDTVAHEERGLVSVASVR